MTEPPNKRVTASELRRLFIDDNLDSQIHRKVTMYEKPTPPHRGHPAGTVTIGFECFNAEGQYIGLVFHYKQSDGTLGQPSPKEFLINGIWHWV